MVYSGTVDNKTMTSKYITFGPARHSGETLTSVIFDAVLVRHQRSGLRGARISRGTTGTVYAPRRVRAFIGNVGGGGGFVFNPLTGRGGAAAQPLLITDGTPRRLRHLGRHLRQVHPYRPARGATFTLGGTPA